MTRSLPDSANLDWLRKSARQLLRQWQAEGRVAKLAEAQFALARDHGFASWRALKAHVEASSPVLDAAAVDGFLRRVGEGDVDAVRNALRDRPALVNAVGQHPFWGGRPQALHLSVESGREAMFGLLLEHGADPKGSNRDYDNWSPLMLAAFNARGRMIEALREAGAHVGLCEALLLGDDNALDRNLSAGPRVLRRNVPMGSLLGLARTTGAIGRLLDLGVSPLPKDRWGADALEALSRLGEAGRPLVDALSPRGLSPGPADLARMGDRDALQARAREEPSLLRRGEVLMAAVDFGHVAIARWLLQNGADPDTRSAHGSRGTALHSAAWNGDVAMVGCLLEFGADSTLLDAQHKATPAHWARTARTVSNNPACDQVAAMLEPA